MPRQEVYLDFESIPQLSTGPAIEPVTRAEAKTHLRVYFTDDDTYIDTLIAAARQHAEDYTQRRFINQTWTQTLPEFQDIMLLSGTPLSSVTSISYLDKDNNSQTLSTAIYDVDTTRHPGAVRRTRDQSFPATYPSWNAVVITYVAGYGAAASAVPEAIKQAILLHVAEMYEQRQVTSERPMTPVAFAYEALLAPYRVWL